MQREHRVRELFEAASGMTGENLTSFLDRECNADTDLRNRVHGLLHVDAQPSDWLDEALVSAERWVALAAAAGDPWQNRLPECIGQYRIVREIGRGASGTVYEGELQSPLRRAAIKVLRPGVSTKSFLRRFEFEAAALRRLDHPCIARFFAAGVIETPDGPWPYFVMELVSGRPLLEHVEGSALTVETNLELLAQICDGVHHAHTRGIIHRDLKPSNILVDSDGHPRILDFGVAASIGDDWASITRQTATGQLIGTLQYMSPEQAAGRADEVDTRSDVFALGLVGYELLAGRPAYDLRGTPLPDAVRAIQEAEPPPLGSLRRRLRGDVETVIAHALTKERDKRYQSAADFASDLRRVLRDEPIAARPPTAFRQFRRFARRNKAAVVATVVVLIALGSASVGSSFGMLRAMAERRRAVAREAEAVAARQDAEAVIDLLGRVLASADPEALGRDVLVRDVLDEASTQMAAALTEKPLLEASLRHTLGTSYLALADRRSADRELSRALELRMTHLGGEHLATLQSMVQMGIAHLELGRVAQAESLLKKALKSLAEQLGAEHPQTLSTHNTLGAAYFVEGRMAEAERIYVDVLKSQRDLLGEGNRDTLDTMYNLSLAYQIDGRYAQAESLLHTILENETKLYGPEHPRTLITLGGIGTLAKKRGHWQEAESIFRRVSETGSRVWGPTHSRTLGSLEDLGFVLAEAGRFAEAERVIQEAMTLRGSMPQDDPHAMDSLQQLALLRQKQGRLGEAEAIDSDILEQRRQTLGRENQATLATMNNLANVYTDLGRYDEAHALHSESIEIQSRLLGEDHPETLIFLHNHAGLYLTEGRDAEALPLVERVLERRRLLFGERNVDTLSSMNMLAVAHERLGHLDEAERLYRKIIASQEDLLGTDEEQTLVSFSNLGDFYNQMGRFDAAKPVLDELLVRAERSVPEDRALLGMFLSKMGTCQRGLGDLAGAEQTLQRSLDLLNAVYGRDHARTRAVASALRELGGEITGPRQRE